VSVFAVPGPESAPGRPRASRPVPLTRLDAAFHAAIPSEHYGHAQRFTADVHVLPAGPWAAHETELGPRAFAVMVLDGLLCQEVLLAGRPSAELLGPGDVVRPWQDGDHAIPCHMRWTCLDAASVALLDDRFVAAARRWPGLMAVLLERLANQLHDAQRRTAIVGLPRVEQRLLAFFWQAADRWGVVRPEGIVIRLKLTHEFLGHVIGAKRPTVTLAIAALAADEMLTRDARGHWTLAHHSVEELQAEVGHGSGAVTTRRARRAMASASTAPLSPVDQSTDA